MRKSRGQELPGTFNPLIIGESFREQCQPWRDIVIRTKDDIVQAVYETTRAVLEHITADETFDSIFRIIGGGVEKFKTVLDRKVIELLDPHYRGHPITYNHYLTDNVQKAQADRRRRGLEVVLQDFLGVSRIKDEAKYVAPLQLLKGLEQRIEVDMEWHASDIATDYMEAYYKVSEKCIERSNDLLRGSRCARRSPAC